MKSFESIEGIHKYFADEKIIETGKQTCVYASAGNDTKIFTFTHPEFLNERLPECDIDIGIYFLIEKEKPETNLNLNFQDEHTTISTETIEEVSLFGLNAHCLQINFASDRRRTQRLIVFRVWSDNKTFSRNISIAGFTPDVFVGVCDGCAFGGNKHCVNDLQIPINKTPKWWITDHFTNADIPDQIRPGSIINSNNHAFPFHFVKRALLSTDWGNYGKWSSIAGATLFESGRTE